MTYTRALNILSFLENETDYAPWVAAITGFNWLRNRLASATTVTELNGLNVSTSSTLFILISILLFTNYANFYTSKYSKSRKNYMY